MSNDHSWRDETPAEAGERAARVEERRRRSGRRIRDVSVRGSLHTSLVERTVQIRRTTMGRARENEIGVIVAAQTYASGDGFEVTVEFADGGVAKYPFSNATMKLLPVED
jgi:hypothetical protein